MTSTTECPRGHLSQAKLSKTKCSCEDCDRLCVRQIWIKGESLALGQKYKMLINVCQGHYDIEKASGSILEEYPTDLRRQR